MRKLLLALALAALYGCSTPSSQINVAKFDTTVRPPTKRVEYFEDESQVRRPFTVIALLTVPGEGADPQAPTVAKVLGEALDEARKLGGEAIILHRTPPQPGQSSPQTIYKVIVFTPVAK